MKTNRPWLRFIEGPNTAGPGATNNDPTPPAGNDGAAPGNGDRGDQDTGDNDDRSGASDDGDDGDGEDPKGRGSKEAVLADLARERDKRQAAEARLAELEAAEKERQREGMTEAEKATADLEALKAKHDEVVAKLAAIEHERQRAAVAAELKIPAAMAGRIQGETPEEMRADAKQLADALGPYTGPSDPSQGRGRAAKAAANLTDALNAHYGFTN
ncbi:DUF4355 domain-containing protein [Corynebacterium hansenii]|uniref:DUF4355 domain-containing protein n=1 Tax=Corynebacterium hansenii TaxID=394964 RepID=A0ABV7ZSJ7_9CORY|nr:DUF4355 domain-containing protein [Corynebacterium hansenii]WJZ00665.1 hypothetical protein CHAN_10320 [Corynebacterium hansenii]